MTIGEAYVCGLVTSLALAWLAWHPAWKRKARHGSIPGRLLVESMRMREGRES